ncbi:hypothetical protein O181_075281 [Austropuccinia psidii MF-1]|uniref:Uncharacterized protein n=1 Tax=Austropuccinia psidii MF-1 TaxID=1389203 RepID=A0A9Q3FEC6_9BASI|nr:hypothetical protein [Austropuccinia psidii MF-1]
MSAGVLRLPQNQIGHSALSDNLTPTMTSYGFTFTTLRWFHSKEDLEVCLSVRTASFMSFKRALVQSITYAGNKLKISMDIVGS